MFGVSVLSVFQYWDYEEKILTISKQLQLRVSNKDISAEIKKALNNSQFDDARMYLEIAKSYHYHINYKKFGDEIRQNDTPFKRTLKKLSSFSEGFTQGKGRDLAGIAGAISADFTVIGDVRDLSEQYKKYEKGDDVNELIVVLSGAGIGLTALTIGSMGSAAPVKVGASIIKLSAKTQKMTPRFKKTLLKLGSKIFDWSVFTRLSKQNKSIKNLRFAASQAYHPEAIKPFQVMAKQVDTIRKSSSTMDAVHLLKFVETSNDLKHLEIIVLKHGSKTKGLMELLGKGAIRTERVLRKTLGLFSSIFVSIFSGLLSLAFLLTFKKVSILLI